MINIAGGVYPTMITPYKNGEIDYDMVKRLVDWYIEKGCHGIFAVCQSSEMAYLSLKERVKLAETIVNHNNGRINIVASGHCADSVEVQAEEANEISKTGVDAFVLVSNRFDLHNDGDTVWRENAEIFLDKANKDIPLGVYECPKPYKRLLSENNIDWMKNTGRFKFIKDTCCDPDLLAVRGKQLEGTGVMLFNANGQTFYHSLLNGGSGYSGIMANFHPELYVWLYENYKTQPQKAEKLSNYLSMMAFTENPAYPNTAKYSLNLSGLDMEIFSISSDEKMLNEYQKYIVKQMHDVASELTEEYK